MIRIGVVSDTHGLLRPEVVEELAGVDLIIHAGDVGRQEVLTRLANIAPTHAIRGNVDTAPWAGVLPSTLALEVEGRMIYVIHDVKELASMPAPDACEVVIYGHTHRADIAWRDGALYLNPGSAGPRRFRLPITLATLEIADGGMRPRIQGISV